MKRLRRLMLRVTSGGREGDRGVHRKKRYPALGLTLGPLSLFIRTTSTLFQYIFHQAMGVTRHHEASLGTAGT